MRLRGGVQPYSGYLEVSYSDEWGFVCDSGSWTIAEANIVCKQLGFGRGIRSTTQGMSLVTQPMLQPTPNQKELRLMVSKSFLNVDSKNVSEKFLHRHS